jgi:anti-anti-sigma factor
MTAPSWNHVRCPVVVLRITESQVHGDALAETLRDEFLAAYQQSGAQHAVLDMGQVTYISSAGIRPLLGLNRCAHENGGRLVLCNLQPEIASVLTITRLISSAGTATFETQPDAAGAVACLYQLL